MGRHFINIVSWTSLSNLMGKLSLGEIKDSPKVTRLERGRAGSDPFGLSPETTRLCCLTKRRENITAFMSHVLGAKLS